MRGSAQQNSYRRGYDVNPIDTAYSSSHKDFDNEERGPRRRRYPGDDLRNLKVESLEFDSNRNPQNYLDCLQTIERIIKLTTYNDDKAIKLVILKLKRYTSL